MRLASVGRGLPASLRRRWWIIPLALLLLAGALVLRALAAPLGVSASVNNGDLEVVRSSAVVLTFSQDMDTASVRNGFHIDPTVPYTITIQNTRTFLLRPNLQPDTQYRVRVTGARKSVGFGELNYALTFHTEAAPRVTALSFNNAPLADGQHGVPLHGNLQVTFSQPMDAGHTPLSLDGAAIDGRTVTWNPQGTVASTVLTLKHSRAHSLALPQTTLNRRHDAMTADWKLTFTAMAQVPSAGSTSRIGSTGAPVIIQIENSDQATVRPQTGVQQADMIYEYISEFGIPRLSAVYWHPPSSLIGPVRSCRLITVQLEMMYRGMIYCSGANDYVLGQVWKWPNVVYDYAYWLPLMYRAADRYAPHNVIARPDQVTAYTAQANLAPLLYEIAAAHDDAPIPGATPATTISVAAHNVTWRYDPSRREYLKWQDGAPFKNVGTGQLHAKTVIVEHVQSFLDANPANTGVHHTYKTEYYELAGQGTADIYTDGTVVHATWQHPDRNVPVVYYDANGDPIDLNTGLTWVHVVGSDQ